MREDNNFLNAWQIFIALLSLYSVLVNGFFAAFGFHNTYRFQKLMHCHNNQNDCFYIWSDIGAELCFLLDICFNFFVEYKSEEKLQPVRDFTKIAERYLKGTFLLDFIAFVPIVGII